MKNFALFGVAGYVVPRHMAAIQEIGGNLVSAIDPSDSVRVLDTYFPKADFFVSFEQFERIAFKHKAIGTPIDFVSVYSPNFLHDTHC